MVRHESTAEIRVALLLLIEKSNFSCIFYKVVHIWTLLQEEGLPDNQSQTA